MWTSAPPHLRSAIDYNRGLPRPVRWAHVVWAGIARPVRALAAWAVAPGRSDWAPPLLLGAAGIALLLPFDGVISKALESHQPGGDVKKELLALQQYGQLAVSLLVALVIGLLDPPRRRRLLDWLAAGAAAAVMVGLLKALIGRPRPKFDDPWVFLGPFGEYAVRDGQDLALRHSWEFWKNHATDLWSMPSSHTAYACVMSVALAAMYPRLRAVAVLLAATVGLCRVWFDAHYPTDVVAGAAVGVCAARLAMGRRWGQRLRERTKPRRAEPAGR